MAKAFPSIELSDAVDMTQDLGIEEFDMGDNYVAVEEKAANKTRQRWNWVWQDITQDQFEILRAFFLTNPTDYINWTPPAQATTLKFRPIAGTLRGAFRGYDNTRLVIPVAQVYSNA